MIYYKTAEEIEKLRASNILVSKTLAEVAKAVKPGVTTAELDRIAETFIRDNGAIPGFLGYNSYPKTLCTSVNQQVVSSSGAGNDNGVVFGMKQYGMGVKEEGFFSTFAIITSYFSSYSACKRC